MRPLFLLRALRLASTALIVGSPTLAQEAPVQTASEYLRSYTNPPQLDGRANAALEYVRIWDTITGPDNAYFMQHYIWYRNKDTEGNHRDGPDDKERAFLARHSDMVEHLVGAAAIPDCRWGLPKEPGMDDVQYYFPAYAQRMRSSSWLLAADGQRCIDEGKLSAAVDRIVALIRMSCQNKDDHYLMMANVSSQWCRAALDLTQLILDKGEVTPAMARPILEALKRISRDDPFGLCSSIEGEQHRTLANLSTRYTGASAGAHFMADMNTRFARDQVSNLVVGLNEEQFQKQLRGVEAYLTRYAALWRQPDADVERSELDDEAAEGQYGVLTPLMPLPSRIYYRIVMQVRTRADQAMRTLADIIERNEKPPPNGPKGPQSP